MKGLYVIVPVWGEHYVRRWLDISLASLLAPGNLPALAQAHDVKVLVYTTQADLPLITASPAIQALRAICGVRLMPFAPSANDLGVATNVVMTTIHNRGLEQAWQDERGVILLVADSLYADGSLATVSRMIQAGKRAVLTQGLNAPQGAVEPLIASPELRDGAALKLPARRLARIVLDTLHWSCRLQFWDAPEFSSHPAMIYWPSGERGLLMRCFHLYPLFVHPDRRCQATSTIDNDFIDRALASPDDCALVGDSDDGLFLDVIDPGRTAFHPAVPFPANPAYVAAWCRLWTTPFTRALIRRHKFWVHDGLPLADRGPIEARSDEAINSVMDLYARGEAAAKGFAA